MKRPLDASGDRDNLILGAAAAVLVVLTVGGAWVSLHLAAVLTGTPRPARDPLRLVVALATGRVTWTGTATAVAVGLAVVLLVGVLAVILLWPKGKPGTRRMRPDLSARHMGRGRDVAHLTAAGSARTATRLGTTGPGLPLGRAVAGKTMLHTSWEDMAILVAGPRTQKTTAYAIPAVLAAPGACLATSNKRDLVDATAAIRAQRGPVWVFDPQNIAERPAPGSAQGSARWWWNPLTYVTSETRADRLAGQLVASARPAGAKTDAYFDSEAENLISLLLLAAACDRRPMTDVYSWLTRPRSEEAADVLQGAGYGLQHQTLYALSHLPDKQMQGVYGTARALLKWLQNREVAAWITPGAGEEFSPELFARSSGTLYPLSREGTGSVGPLVAALTMAVLDALEESATASGGRLVVPFVGVLDEAANICRIRGLDAYYSHFGSRGIILLTILQSWAQGAEAWGTFGMEKLWSSANARVYGGGVDDPAFLRRLSDLIGTAQQVHRTANVGSGKRTITRAVQEHAILTPAELRELPQGRAVLFASGTPAILTHPVPWWDGPHADAIRGALAAA